MKHSIECMERQKAWDEAYPNRCKKCNGAGGFSFPGFFNHKAGVGEPPSFDECGECTGQNKCPLCGTNVGDFWEYGDVYDELLPCGHPYVNEPPECECGWATQICDNCGHEMIYENTIEYNDSYYSYDIEIFICPYCGSQKEW
jgi:hypothetical protein